MFRRTSAAACAVAIVGSALVGLTVGTANAAPGCPDVHWFGAAGSGERTAADMAGNGGMGQIVYQSYQALQQQLAAEGRTITAEAVESTPVLIKGEGTHARAPTTTSLSSWAPGAELSC